MPEATSEQSSALKPRGTRQKRLELRIVLDTNQLYTASASDLLCQEVARLIEDSRRHTDVRVTWYVPEIVKLERTYQMREAARELIPPLAKLEKLLGFNLGIGEDLLDKCVNSVIDKQVTSLAVCLLPLDAANVDWQRLIADAAARRPPFEPGKHEKGFRDAIVAEAFMQLVNSSPKSPSACRVALVTGDGLLASAVEERTKEASNVRTLRSLDELKDLINTVVADVTEDFVKAVRDMAGKCFFVKEDQTTLYYKEDIRSQIASRFGAELHGVPPGAESRKNDTWYVGPPRFSRKKRQRVYWVTTIRVAAKAFKSETYKAPSLNLSSFGLDAGALAAGVPRAQKEMPGSLSFGSVKLEGLQPTVKLSDLLGTGAASTWPLLDVFGAETLHTREVLIAEGQSVFEVSWSVTVTARKNLINPSLDEIRHVETSWEGGPAA